MFPQTLNLPLQVAKGVVSLWPWFTVSIAQSSSKKFAIQLTTSEQVLFLAANTLSLMNKWLYHIQTQRLLDPPKKGAVNMPLLFLSSPSRPHSSPSIHPPLLLLIPVSSALFPCSLSGNIAKYLHTCLSIPSSPPPSCHLIATCYLQVFTLHLPPTHHLPLSPLCLFLQTALSFRCRHKAQNP